MTIAAATAALPTDLRMRLPSLKLISVAQVAAFSRGFG